MDTILFLDKWNNFIDTLEKLLTQKKYSSEEKQKAYELCLGEFLEEFCDENMKFIDQNIEKWHRNYLEIDRLNMEHVESIWGEGFALYKFYIESRVKFSDEYLKYIEKTERFYNNIEGQKTFTALRYLSGRATQVANEILVLLKNGYADAAYARFRTLYELSIISDFIVKHGDNVAQAYIEYDGNWYDWAKEIIPNKRQIKFSDIEKYSGIQDEYIKLWNKEYKLSNKLVHASSQGTFSRLAIDGQMREILIGPCDNGIVVPAVNSLESLYHIDGMYFGWDKEPFALTWVNILKELKEKTYNKFKEIETTLK